MDKKSISQTSSVKSAVSILVRSRLRSQDVQKCPFPNIKYTFYEIGDISKAKIDVTNLKTIDSL